MMPMRRRLLSRASWLLVCVLALASASRYVAPTCKALYVETFQSETTRPSINWIPSEDSKYNGPWIVDEPPFNKLNFFPGDKYLTATKSHRYYGISHKFAAPINPSEGKRFILQYEFRPMQNWDCAGGYMKLFSDPKFDPKTFSGDDKYSIMFGPDRCSGDAKVHFIIQAPDPKTGKLVEHHMKNPPEPKLDPSSHHYQLLVDLAEQTFTIFVDLEEARSGSLREEFEPPLVPPKEIDDPNDRQPADWVTQERISDPNDVKPDDWDESIPEFIPDPDAEKPEDWDEDAPEYIEDASALKPDDWDDEEDGPWIHPKIPNPICSTTGCGKWMRPRIRNPAYRGKWVPRVIDNPAYKGPWAPRKIPNPDYVEMERPFELVKPITAIGFDWWQVQENSGVDNIVIGRNKKAMDEFAEETWRQKHVGEREMMERSFAQSTPSQQPVKKWKIAAVAGFIGFIVALILILRKFCGTPVPMPKENSKPKGGSKSKGDSKSKPKKD